MKASPPERYEEISQHLLKQAQEELDRNDVLQASEKAWCATAHAIKGVSQTRGWNHRYHNHLRDAVGYIDTERQSKGHLRGMYVILNSLHDNFYEHQLSKLEVQYIVETARAFTVAMQEVRLDGPPEDQSHLSLDEQRDQARLLRNLTREIRYAHEDEFTGDELDGLPPVQPEPI